MPQSWFTQDPLSQSSHKRTGAAAELKSHTATAFTFERAYRAISGSQIEALKALNSAPQADAGLRHIYAAAADKHPEFYAGFSFEDWLAFLRGRDFIEERQATYFLSDAGKNFLRYLVNSGYPENKFG
jgi:hypothetical protein